MKTKAAAMKVVCITGKANSGKDTAARFLKDDLELRGYRVLITHYADLVKYICTAFFDWDGEKDEKGRTLLQVVGSEKVRSKSPDFWVNFIVDILKFFPNEWDYILIPDCRFPNEYEVLIDAGYKAVLLRINREDAGSPLTPDQQQHISETALDNYKYDYYIENGSTLDELRESIKELTTRLEQRSFSY